MTVTVLPGADQVHDEHARIAFEYIESHGVFTPPRGPATVTGSRGGNVALASLLTQLAAIGAIVDATTV